MKPMEYGSNHQHTLDSGNLNPFFKQIVEDYKKENESLKAQINQLRKEVDGLRFRESDTSSVSSAVHVQPKPTRSPRSTIKPSSPRPVSKSPRKRVQAKEEVVNMSHIPFGLEPEVFNVFIFSFFAIMFLLFVDKTLTGKGIKIF